MTDNDGVSLATTTDSSDMACRGMAPSWHKTEAIRLCRKCRSNPALSAFIYLRGQTKKWHNDLFFACRSSCVICPTFVNVVIPAPPAAVSS